jgi:hypothetical protein
MAYRTPRLERVALVRPETRETEVELHDRSVGVELRELLEPVERAVRPLGERGAHLRLERVVLGEKGGGGGKVPPRIQPRGLRELLRLQVGAEAERERERRTSGAERRRRRRAGRASRAVARRDHDCCDDGDGRHGDCSHGEHDAAAGGHRRTIARR